MDNQSVKTTIMQVGIMLAFCKDLLVFSKKLNLPKSSSFSAGLVVSDFSYSSAFDCDAVNNMNKVSS